MTAALATLRLFCTLLGAWSLTLAVLWTLGALLWRLPCWLGHHRHETVKSGFGQVWLVCLDCGHQRELAHDIVFTPSRRYALTRKSNRHRRAA